MIIIFGFPGAGKTYVGNILKKYFDFYLYDGDKSLTSDMKEAIETKATITDDMRDVFFQNIIKKAQQLKVRYNKIVIAQTFIKEKYRVLFVNKIPEAQFILVQANKRIRETRLMQRKKYLLDLEYTRKMCFNFDTPYINYDIVINNIDGEVYVKRQLQSLLNQK